MVKRLSLSLSLSVRFNGYFPGEPGLAFLVKLRMMEVVVTTGTIGRAKLQAPVKSSPPTNQHPKWSNECSNKNVFSPSPLESCSRLRSERQRRSGSTLSTPEPAQDRTPWSVDVSLNLLSTTSQVYRACKSPFKRLRRHECQRTTHRLFYRVILHKLCIIKINLCIVKCQIVYL